MDLAKLTSDMSSVNLVILACTALLCFLAFLNVSKLRSGWLSSSQPPPSPWRLPIIGNLHQLLSASVHQSLHALSLKHGPLMRVHFGSVPMFVVSSGELAREVMKTREAEFSDRVITEAIRALFEGGVDFLFNPVGLTQARKVCVTGALSQKRVQALQFIREEEVARFITKLRRLVNDRCAQVNLSDMFITLTSTTVSGAVLGLKSADEGGHDNNLILGQLAKQAVSLLTEVFAVGDFVPALGWVDHLRGHTRETKRVSQAVHEFLDRVIDERLEKQNDDYDRKYFVDILLELQVKKDLIGGHELTRKEIRAVLLVLFIAGIDSSAKLLEQTMKELVKNPRIMIRLQEEIRNVVGKKFEIHQNDLSQMKYLKCVIKETLRLHSPVLAARVATEDVDVRGFKIPANGFVLINKWAIHRDPATWDRPLEFCPERFLDACYDFTGRDEKYFPFGLGRKICPGVQFGMFIIEYTLANVLCWFDWELPDGMSAQHFDMSVAHGKLSLHLVPVRPSPASQDC